MTAVTERPLIRLATRGSPLALWQAQRVAALLDRVGVASSLVVIETTGDRELDLPLDRIGGQGVFVKEVQAGRPHRGGRRRCPLGQGPSCLGRSDCPRAHPGRLSRAG